MRLPSDSLTALDRSENLIGRLYMRMPANMCSSAHRNFRPARMLLQTAYREVFPTNAGFLRRQNQDYRQSGASNLFVVASVSKRRRKCALRLPGERAQAPDSSGRAAYIWRAKPQRAGLPPWLQSPWTAQFFQDDFSLCAGTVKALASQILPYLKNKYDQSLATLNMKEY